MVYFVSWEWSVEVVFVGLSWMNFYGVVICVNLILVWIVRDWFLNVFVRFVYLCLLNSRGLRLFVLESVVFDMNVL